MPMIFSESMLPEQLVISDIKNDYSKENITIDLHEPVNEVKTQTILKEKHEYLSTKGALYYEL